MKYIIFEMGGLELPFIFSSILTHADVAQHFSRSKVISAGFLKRDDSGNLYTTGESISLDVKSRPEDLELIIQHLEFSI